MIRRGGWVFAFLTAACGGGSGGGDGGVPDGTTVPDANDGRVTVVEVAATANRDLDVLFVIDDSGSMTDKQQNLANNFPNFINVLASLPGGLPNLHLGVVTTDLGTDGADDSAPAPAIGTIGQGGCASRGKDGRLLTSGAPVSGTFVSDIAQTDGSRLRNYTGTLSAVFSQMARVGATGCGFEQPLEAMRRALDNNAANAGFLRPSAQLAVVILADEDDCSVKTPALFTADTSTFGTLNSFRCTRFGVTCTSGGATPDEMNQIGAKSGCTGGGSSQLVDVASYRQFLVGLKGGNASKVAVGAIIGNPTPVAVELRAQPGGGPSIPALAHSCMYAGLNGTEVADPGVRLAAFAAQFPNRSSTSTICQPDLSGGLTAFSQVLAQALGSPCITVELADADPGTAGLQADCIVEDVVGATVTPIPPCGASGPATCWRIESDPGMCPAGDNLRLAVTRPAAPDPATVTRARCRTL